MVIDAHTHLLQGTHPCEDIPQSLDDLPDVDLTGLLAGLDDQGVEVVVTLAQEMTRIRGQWLGSNELAADIQQKLEGRFIGFAGFEPMTPKNQFNKARYEQVEELVKSRRVKGLLITPPYGHYELNDRRAYPFYQMAAEYDVPIYVHQGAAGGPPHAAPQFRGWLWTLDQVVVDFPDLRLNIEHMARPWGENLLSIMAHGPNVWTDVSLLSTKPHLLAWHLTLAGDYGVLDRIFWGTDYCGRDNATYLPRLARELDFYRERLNPLLEASGWPTLSAEQIDGILGDNFRRFLGL